MEEFLKLLTENFGSITILVTACIGATYGIREFVTHKKEKIETINSFNETVKQLASDNIETQLSAAILLRRFLKVKFWFHGFFLFDETINVISSLLRTLPTGIYQKTLGDGLAYAKDLSNKDLQKTNMQDLYIGSKEYRIKLKQTDLFMADLSYALLQNIDGENAIFYNAILLCTQIKNCNFQNANFMGTDLTNVHFKNVQLNGASFINAINIPIEIEEKLVDGIFYSSECVTTSSTQKGKAIFFSLPGMMAKNDELIAKEYKRILENRGFEVIYYIKDDYPRYGQFNKIRESIMRSSGVVAFGFKQINIVNGIYRPRTNKEEILDGKWLSTPWSEVEVGMALMKGLPILLVHDEEINRGVFDDNLNECFVGKLSSCIDIRNIERNHVFDEWLSKV